MAYRKNVTPSTPKSTKYRIHDASEETFCDSCGCPLLIGDRAILSEDERRAACSHSCFIALEVCKALDAGDYRALIATRGL